MIEYNEKQGFNTISIASPSAVSNSTNSRRTNNEIQELIVNSLKKFPKSTYGIAKDCNMKWITAYRHLCHLENLEKLRSETLERPTATGKKKLNPIIYWVIK